MGFDRNLTGLLPCAALAAALALPVPAKGLPMLTVTCTAAAAVAADRAAQVCDEFLTVLAQSLPDRRITRAEALPAEADGLAVMVDAATATTVGLQLTWHKPGAAPVAARPLALSVMDRDLSPPMRADFYRRVLSDTPIPL